MIGRARPLLLWLLAMLAGIVIVWHSRFTADLSFFLPARPTAEQQVLVDQLKEGAVSRLMMLAIAGGDAARRAELSRELRRRLAAGPDFVLVQNGEAGSLDADRDFLLRHRYLLSPTVNPQRFDVDGLRQAIGDSIDRLASPAGMMLKTLLPRDPTSEFVTLLGMLAGDQQPASRAGVWASRDGERAMLLVQTRALGSDTDGQQAAIERLHGEFAAIAGKTAEFSLQVSGPGVFAVNSRASMKKEVARLSLISSLAITAVLLFIYRSPRLLGLGMLPVVSGALAGIVAVSLVFGTVFAITVGFGAALIGESVDYAIYYFLQSGHNDLDTWRRRFWPTIRLGVLTSVAGFGVLLFSGFPGLAQLGLYALAGIATAAAVTRFVLPTLGGGHLGVRDLKPLGRALQTAIDRLSGLRWPTLLLALAAIVLLVGQRDQLWNQELAALSPINAADSELDMALRADLGAPDSRYLVLVAGSDRESTLQSAEVAAHRLDSLVAAGRIAGYDSPARFLPSQARQAERRASLPPPDELRARLRQALADSPLDAAKLEPFLADIDAVRQQPPLERADLDGSNLALAVDSLLLPGSQGWSALLPLRPTATDIDADEVRRALADSGALFIDMKIEFDRLYNDYLHEAMLLAASGMAAVALLLALTLRSPRRLAAVMLPLLLAVVIVIAGLHLAGERLNLMHLIGMLLIVAIGSNYVLFFDQGDNQPQLAPETLASMLIATITTTIGFGALALSDVPVLHALGVTVSPGAFLTLLLAAIFVSRGTTR